MIISKLENFFCKYSCYCNIPEDTKRNAEAVQAEILCFLNFHGRKHGIRLLEFRRSAIKYQYSRISTSPVGRMRARSIPVRRKTGVTQAFGEPSRGLKLFEGS